MAELKMNIKELKITKMTEIGRNRRSDQKHDLSTNSKLYFMYSF